MWLFWDGMNVETHERAMNAKGGQWRQKWRWVIGYAVLLTSIMWCSRSLGTERTFYNVRFEGCNLDRFGMLNTITPVNPTCFS